MSKDTPVRLDDRTEKFVEEQISSGRFASASDVVRAALELMEEHEAKLAVLRDAIQEGLDSGEAKPLDREAFFAKARGRTKSIG
jgi:antitoxin ParD1/3/4